MICLFLAHRRVKSEQRRNDENSICLDIYTRVKHAIFNLLWTILGNVKFDTLNEDYNQNGNIYYWE